MPGANDRSLCQPDTGGANSTVPCECSKSVSGVRRWLDTAVSMDVRGITMKIIILVAALLVTGLNLSADSLDHWTVRSTNVVHAISYEEGRFFALGPTGIFVSDDGTTWPTKPMVTTEFTDLTSGN